jgi:hypothetical protein
MATSRPEGTAPTSIDLDGVASKLGVDAQVLEAQRIQGGFALAKWMLGFVGLVLTLIAVYAALTYPDPAMTKELVPDSSKRLAAYQDLREDWFTDVKDLLQLLVVSLLIPLLATLVGYIFGRQLESSTQGV